MPCHSAWSVAHRRWNRNHRAGVGSMGFRDGTVLWLHQAKCCTEQETRPGKYRQSNPRNDPAGNGEDEVWAHKEAFSQANA